MGYHIGLGIAVVAVLLLVYDLFWGNGLMSGSGLIAILLLAFGIGAEWHFELNAFLLNDLTV